MVKVMWKHVVTWWRRVRAPRSTRHLYVLRVDFAVGPEQAKEMAAMRDRLLAEYGVDLLVLEPGMTLSRFNDI